jgi:hypothetical protein
VPDKQLIAFAVWDGDNANRGKKQITNWLPMRLQPQPTVIRGSITASHHTWRDPSCHYRT